VSGGGCGSSGRGRPQVTVFAAASLRQAFTSYAQTFGRARVRLSLAGSDQLAAQIQQGVHPDVFASADRERAQALFAARLVERPVPFATNRLVIAVPSGSSRLHTLSDLARPGVKLAIGSPSVPVGAYTRQVLSRLPARQAASIMANVRSQEPDVSGIVGKLTQGAVDGGFLYATDVRAASSSLRTIELPAALAPQVVYAVAAVRGAPHPALARAFVAGLLRGRGHTALAQAGFGPPPAG
jgi:molybdate transport system substrate-binding protein